ncbi:PAS domain-containing protein [Pseudobacteriovorax antillogorgiicola]|uniref:PAS domain S-box-containing protein n=1 Tax=Pseudobacteriovorax antillogorgiicola TaxID=1513793 RepID=A0A1Y6BCY1_9BACT|nr:PAS domain-containing protein [Pseudobacteriovorax antillogorgiicola]TCS58504.1 PAS domain S-box-containing protein [Pseudobacteriovorax antillogorgiicola]SME98167.1 PAS domain S-box-containing protein [Pseudobacteriovorax antillogorgiicola]
MNQSLSDPTAELIAATQSLAASHEIVVELERAKRNIEQMIDGLTTSFAIISEAGIIYKANRLMAQYFNVSIEELLGRQISDIFHPEVWSDFQEKEMILINAERKHHIEIELPIVDYEGKTKEILWTMRPLSGISGNFQRLYQILGHDISKVKEYERQIDVIFSHIPIGLFTINRSLRIEGTYSEYTKTLLGSDSLDGKSLLDLLSGIMEGYLRDLQLKKFRILKEAFGQSHEWYEKNRVQLPSELEVQPLDSQESVKICLNYNPVYMQDHIDRFIIMINEIKVSAK